MFAKLKRMFRRQPTADEWQIQFGNFKRSLAALPPDNTLWPGLLALLDRIVADETEELCKPGVSTEELHRSRGRIGMLLDLKDDLAALPAKARAEIEATIKKS